MKLPIQITFHGMSHSDPIEADVRERARHLERFCDDIVSCRVGLDVLPHPRHQGRLYGVRIDLTITGHELVVDRVEADDVHVALRNAFDSMARRLEDAVRRRRGFERDLARDPFAEPTRGTLGQSEAG